MSLKVEICNTFNKHAIEYEQAAKIQNEIGQRLFERLDYLKINPRYILDLGCGTGLFTLQLKKKYPKAEIVGLDLAKNMLFEAKKKQGWWRSSKWSLINGDMTLLPFATGTFDLVFANQTIHWAQPLDTVIRELNRVMNNQGCLMFSTLGPDTFKELKQAWLVVDNHAHTNEFADMHDVGDCLLKERFLDPVVDMELITVHYENLKKLLLNLKAQGVRNINEKRNGGLTGKDSWQAFEKAYQVACTKEGKFPLTYEVVYGHAWKGAQRLVDKGTETFIPISRIQRQPDADK
ncbi:malonyl-ACP O-methyltransferase BioC [Legionella cardiaca]|uniref:Malonyl-[acyl-carrier protein] O-methyltransferase n=1 Tax=Legionella cardiaca TaxID=1071983 RepID=A0ABY8AY63_9GAMM|nr:malonyl-ACP O-methyltransferase BioC [Legionella cardiaca]WED44671.1 malonyl-ACP O-methyltransferase BioC [Legionella cardiaca]